MQKSRIAAVLSGLALIISLPTFTLAAPLRLNYGDLGLLQLAAHDFFRVDRTLGVNLENGKLDLSTIFDYGANRIPLGGEVRNSENIMVFTAAKKYADAYVRFVAQKVPAATARTIVVSQFVADLKGAYLRLLPGEGIPAPGAGSVTMTEDLAFRIIHDLVPGQLRINGMFIPLLDPSLQGKVLSRQDQKNPGAILDGQFDSALRNIVFVIPPSTTITLDLLALDSSFATQFNTDFSFEHFLGEAVDGKLDKNEKVTGYIRSLFAKGFAN